MNAFDLWIGVGSAFAIIWWATRPVTDPHAKYKREHEANKRRFIKTDDELAREAALKLREAAFLRAERESRNLAWKRAAEVAQRPASQYGLVNREAKILPLFPEHQSCEQLSSCDYKNDAASFERKAS